MSKKTDERILTTLYEHYISKGVSAQLLPKGSPEAPKKLPAIKLTGMNIDFIQVKAGSGKKASAYGRVEASGKSKYSHSNVSLPHVNMMAISCWDSETKAAGINEMVDWFYFAGKCEIHYIVSGSSFAQDGKYKSKCMNSNGQMVWKGGLANHFQDNMKLNQELAAVNVQALKVLPKKKANQVRIVDERQIMIETEAFETKEGECKTCSKRLPSLKELKTFDGLAGMMK